MPFRLFTVLPGYFLYRCTDMYLAVAIDDSTYDRIKRIAEEKGESIQEVVRKAVELYIALSAPRDSVRLVLPWYQ